VDKRILSLKKLIDANLQSQLSIEELALSVRLSSSHLLKLFKTEVGISPIQYLRHVRLEKAKELLEKDFKLIKEISWEIGIKDVSHFVRDFKQRYGVTPSKYRQQMKQSSQFMQTEAMSDNFR
jgi:transcriptional regulator GlxA family with amidase domain